MNERKLKKAYLKENIKNQGYNTREFIDFLGS